MKSLVYLSMMKWKGTIRNQFRFSYYFYGAFIWRTFCGSVSDSFGCHAGSHEYAV